MEKRILLVDDDSITNFINKTFLSKYFPEVEILIFDKPRKALDYLYACNESKIFLFLDINMPLITGWQFLEKLSEKPTNHKLTTFMLTSSIDKADKQRANQNPMVARYLIKPIEKESIESIQAEYTL